MRVLVVVDQLDDELGAERLEEGDLAQEALLAAHELERDLALGLHVHRQLDRVEAAHRRRLLELVPALVEVRRRVAALADAAQRADRGDELLARADRDDAHLAQVVRRELRERLEVDLLPDEDARVLAKAEAVEPRDELVAALVAAGAAAARAPPPLLRVAVELRLVEDARVERAEVGAAAEAAEHEHLRRDHRRRVAVARRRRHAGDVGLRPRHRLRVEDVDARRRVRAPVRRRVRAVLGRLARAAKEEDAPADRLRRVAEERPRRDAARRRLDPRHGARVEDVEVAIDLLVGRAAVHVDAAADDRRRVAHAPSAARR